MYPPVLAALARSGLITRPDAIAAGMSVGEVDRLVRSGAWVAVWRGVYTTAEHWVSLDEHVGRPLLRVRAASAHTSTPHLLSHDSAALELGLSVLDAAAQPVHLTRAGVVGSRHRHGVVHHKAPFGPDEVVVLPDGRDVLGPARTVCDIARHRGLEAGLVSADSALAQGVSRAQLGAAAGAMVSWPHVLVVRRVVALADAGAESPGETLTRIVLVELGHAPQTQFGLRVEGREMWCDLRVGRHVIEFDGRAKYGADVDPEAAARRLWDEKLRQDALTRQRLGVSRVVWADLFGQRRADLARRLEREIAETAQRWGTDLGDLAPYLLRGPRRPVA